MRFERMLAEDGVLLLNFCRPGLLRRHVAGQATKAVQGVRKLAVHVNQDRDRGRAVYAMINLINNRFSPRVLMPADDRYFVPVMVPHRLCERIDASL
jgi:hypothetical protein